MNLTGENKKAGRHTSGCVSYPAITARDRTTRNCLRLYVRNCIIKKAPNLLLDSGLLVMQQIAVSKKYFRLELLFTYYRRSLTAPNLYQ